MPPETREAARLQALRSVTRWNDAPWRTQAQVLALIDRVLGIAAEANREPTR